jgi:hypothetical protein
MLKHEVEESITTRRIYSFPNHVLGQGAGTENCMAAPIVMMIRHN